MQVGYKANHVVSKGRMEENPEFGLFPSVNGQVEIMIILNLLDEAINIMACFPNDKHTIIKYV